MNDYSNFCEMLVNGGAFKGKQIISKKSIKTMKKKWADHEKDIEFHIKMICKNHILKYVSQEQFPYPRNKPDNTVLISDQYIIFDLNLNQKMD